MAVAPRCIRWRPSRILIYLPFQPPQLHSVAINCDTGRMSHEAGQVYVLDLLLVHRLKDLIKEMFSCVLIRQLFNGMD